MRPLEGGDSVEQTENSMYKDEIGGNRKPPKDISMKKKTTRAVSKGPGGLPLSTLKDVKEKRLSMNAASNLS